MLSIFDLATAINESASGRYCGPVVAHEFGGDLNAATAQMNYILMAEAVEVAEFCTGADEIMTEAAVSNPRAIYAMSENVFSTIGAKVKAIWEKLKKMVKGMIEKIKAFLYKLTGKIDKWVTVMEPRIKAVLSENSSAPSETIEVTEWNTDFVTKGFQGPIKELCDAVEAETRSNDKGIEELKRRLESETKGYNINAETRDKTAEQTKDKVKQMAQGADTIKHQTEADKKTYIASIGSKFQISNVNNLEDLWTQLGYKAAGKNGKVTKKYSEIAGGPMSCLEVIKNSKTTISDLKDLYENHLEALNKLTEEINKAYEDTSKVEDEDHYNADLLAQYKILATEQTNSFTYKITTLESVINTAKTKQTDYVQKMTSDYMAVLSKFSSLKKKKS